MSTEVIEEIETQPEFANAAADLEKALAANAEEQEKEPEVEKPAAKPESKETKKDDSEFPEHLLTGEKPPDKQPEEDPVLSAEVPKNLSKKGQADFEMLRTHYTQAKAEREAFRVELETLKASAGTKVSDEATLTELKAAREKLAEMESLVERTSFERSPRFQSMIAREKGQIEQAKSYLEGTDVDPNTIELASRATGKARLDILKTAGADAETIAAVTPHLAAFDAIQADKANAVTGLRETQKEWERQEAVRQEQEAARQKVEEDNVFKATVKDVSTKFEPFQRVPGNEKWNAQVDQLETEAKQFFNGEMPMSKLAEIAAYGVGARVIHAMNKTLQSRLNAANAEIASLKSAAPAAGAGQGNGTGKSDEGLSYLDRAARDFNAAVGHT